MNDRRQLLSQVMRDRFREVCDLRISSLNPDEFGEHSSLVSQVKQQFIDAPIEAFQGQQLKPAGKWQKSEPAGLRVLRALAVGELVVTSAVEPPPVYQFIKDLKSARNDESQSLELLMMRYSCPLNFICAPEDDVRELVLEGLMVRDRRRIEDDSIASADTDYLWYRLNLFAVYSQTSCDLRFLDALNYYFELIPADWRSRSPGHGLFVSYLALYARALAANCENFKCA